MHNLQNVDKRITKYYNTSKWNSKSADYILLLLQRNTNEILDVSNQNVDDEGLILIHFFLLLNKKLKAKVKGFNLLGNDFTKNGFCNFSNAIEVLYTGSNAVQTYCGEIVKHVYDDDLMETLIVKVDNFGKVDLDVIGHTLMLNGKCFVYLCVLLYLSQ